MVFIRGKVIKGKPYYYVVENKRVKGKVKQKIIYYIGTATNLLKKLGIKTAETNKKRKVKVHILF